MRNEPIYLDYNATTPIDDRVAEAMKPYLYEHFGNPSSAHPYGIRAKQAVETARAQVAVSLRCSPAEIVFTSGGSEANNMAIKGVASAYRGHIITSAIEHPAVLEPCRYLETQGYRLSILPVDEFAMVDPAEVERAITPETILVSIMHANNEVGTIQRIAEIASIAHSHGALMHTDAAQSLGKVAVNVEELDVDLLSLAGHKFYAPKGIGALYIRSGVKLVKFIHGADHETNRRAGTENVLEIVGLGKAAEIACEDLEETATHMRSMRDRLWRGLSDELKTPEILKQNGHPTERLPNTLSVSFRSIEANTLLSEISDRVAASAGAACHAENIEVSSVLEAMGVPLEYAMGTVRFSVGRMTTPEELEEAVKVVVDAVSRLGSKNSPISPAKTIAGEIKLTHYTHGMGCACKLRPQALEQVLAKLPTPTDPAILVDISTSDDAAVYKLRDDLAVVQTVDFFTPIADDPYDFGAISAANSFSDIYAMGAKPLFALNIVGFPTHRLPLDVLDRILKGALDKATEAGVSIIGGHTVDDTEPKYGMAVTGIVHPDRVVTNAASHPGDQIVLTKPIGTGIIATAIKRGLADEKTVQEVNRWMATLNQAAAEAMIEVGVSACTDVTGFGFLGHLREMTAGAGVDAEVFFDQVPVLKAAQRFAGANVIPGGTRDNLAYVKPHVNWEGGISEVHKLLLADAQTSGGLLIAVPMEKLDSLVQALETRNVETIAHVGQFTRPGAGKISVLRPKEHRA
ncbi:MAG: selenide, water dikinase [Anaerolineae bacterium SM23_ 63]|nr:MAG: selenide, water dikinase [Anaerolineae bacterium SM23_ 63]HEY47094.1 selenide, water dikinase SelD [Anaerolineae bacterium]